MKEIVPITKRQTTLVVIAREKHVLLGMKKRGFGAGLWNCAGGKCEPGERPLENGARETEEEFGILVHNLTKVGELDFTFPDKPEWDQWTTVFFCSHFSGEPQETNEMRPQKFHQDKLPFDQMWESDRQWLPLVLDGHCIRGAYIFTNERKIASYTLTKVDTPFGSDSKD